MRQVDGGRLPLPLDLTSNLTMDLKTWIWTVSGTYALAATPEYTIDVTRARRYTSVGTINGWVDMPVTFKPGPKIGTDLKL